MTFTTPTFLIFLAVVFAVYWRLAPRGQVWWLLIASLIFYCTWNWRYLGLLLFTTGIDFVAALGMEHAAPRRRKLLLAVSLITNLGALCFFKYAHFFVEQVRAALAQGGFALGSLPLTVLLPLGISFYTFHALSYTIDVYRGVIKPVRDPVQYLTFIAFFPQLVAGPIARATSLLPQFGRPRTFDYDEAADGARQMLWGFFKKLVVADNLAVVVHNAYQTPVSTSGWQLLWATYAFAFQIYCDFSGYTDIAIGCAKWFGVSLSRNFAYPYFATSIPDFWRRWHISLTSWFRDYVFLPLGGSRVPPLQRARNILVVFILSGFWHGASWTFVVWGLLHGLLYCVYAYALPPLRARAQRWHVPPVPEHLSTLLRMFITFNLVCIGWIFFRATTLHDALIIIQKIAAAVVGDRIQLPALLLPFCWTAIMLLVEWMQRDRVHGLDVMVLPKPVRQLAYYAIVFAIMFFAQLSFTPFIYFQF